MLNHSKCETARRINVTYELHINPGNFDLFWQASYELDGTPVETAKFKDYTNLRGEVVTQIEKYFKRKTWANKKERYMIYDVCADDLRVERLALKKKMLLSQDDFVYYPTRDEHVYLNESRTYAYIIVPNPLDDIYSMEARLREVLEDLSKIKSERIISLLQGKEEDDDGEDND
jgi:hypothetical protein